MFVRLCVHVHACVCSPGTRVISTCEPPQEGQEELLTTELLVALNNNAPHYARHHKAPVGCSHLGRLSDLKTPPD